MHKSFLLEFVIITYSSKQFFQNVLIGEVQYLPFLSFPMHFIDDHLVLYNYLIDFTNLFLLNSVLQFTSVGKFSRSFAKVSFRKS